MPSDLIITPNRSTGNPKMDFYDASSNLDASITLNVSNGDLEFALPGGGKIVLGNASQNVQIGGNLTVNGTTTTINSTTTTVDDPIFTLGGDTAPGSDDNKDRGIEFRWHNGTVAKVGFFGYDDSTGKFTFIPDATNTSEVFSGTKGTIDANIEWNDILNKPASSGTVTQIDTNNGITGGPITTTGTVGLTGQALALHNLATNGLIARTGSGTVAGRSIAQGTGISVSNGDGVSGNPTVGVDSTVALRADTHFIGTTSVALNRASANLALTGISSVTLPGATSGTVLLQPAATAGTTTITLPATTGTVVTTGDSGTVTSTMIADGTIVNGDINASAAIAITKLAASTISGISLGNNLATLTISTGLTGTSYNGSTAVTIGIDSSVVTTTGSQVLTNKTFTDSTTLFQDQTDNTKKLAFELSGISASTTRTLTIPNVSGTIITTGDTGTVTSTMIADGTIVNGDINASAAIAITKLAASTISGVSLGNNLNALTIGTGLSGTSYNGSAAVTIAIDSTVATLTGTQTFTNKTFTDSTTTFQDDADNTKKMQFQLSGITTANTRTLTVPDASGTIALTSNKLSAFAATTSAELAGVISDETGSGALVFGTSPTFVTSVVTSSASFNVFNTTATTVNAFGSANAVIMGSTSATITLRGGTVVGSETSQNVFNSVATTINAFGGATVACNVGPTTGSMTLRPPTIIVGSGNATIKGASGLTVTAGNGALNLTAETSVGATGDRASIQIPNTDAGAGEVRIQGGNLYLGRKSADGVSYTGVDIVFEGSADDTSETTLTVTNPTADRTITLPDATGTVALTANKLSVFAATTSAELAGVISDETGSGLLVFGTSPTFTTSVLTGSASFDLFNTTATTINAFGAATTLAIGNTTTAAQTVNMFTTSTGASTYNFATGATAAATTKTLNIGTGGAPSSTTNINIGSSNGGTLTSNCPMVSPRLARVSSSAFDTRTGSFSPADTDNGKVFVINIGGKTTATVTLDSLSVGWRARFLILGGAGVTFTSTGGTVFGTFGTGGAGLSAMTEVVEVYCYATNSYIAAA